MSFIRVGPDSDVYVIATVDGFLQCCGCKFAYSEESKTYISSFYQVEISHEGYLNLIGHLKRHKGAGHMVPKRLFRELRRIQLQMARGPSIPERFPTPEGREILVKEIRTFGGIGRSWAVWVPSTQKWLTYHSHGFEDFSPCFYPKEERELQRERAHDQQRKRIIKNMGRGDPSYFLRTFRSLGHLDQHIYSSKVQKRWARRTQHEGPSWDDLESEREDRELENWVQFRVPKKNSSL